MSETPRQPTGPEDLIGYIVAVDWTAECQECQAAKYFEFVVAWAGTTTVGLRPVSGDGVASWLVVAPWSSIATLAPIRAA